jgi:flagellar biosynthesis/type III secretory pathway ATPase
VESAEGDLVRVEVQAHLDRTHIRAVALEPTGRLRRGDRALRTGGPLNTPVGDAVLGRLLTVTGETGDGHPVCAGDIAGSDPYPHRLHAVCRPHTSNANTLCDFGATGHTDAHPGSHRLSHQRS